MSESWPFPRAVLIIHKGYEYEGFITPAPLRTCMGKEEYDISLIGPDGYVDFVAYDHEDAMEIVSNLVKASNGYHEVEVEPPVE